MAIYELKFTIVSDKPLTKDNMRYGFAIITPAGKRKIITDKVGSVVCQKQEKPKAPKKVKPESRAARWSRLAAEASSALEELVDIKGEFEGWKDGLPENLANSSLGEKLSAICDIDLDSALSAAQEAEGAEVPLGFGRD